MLEREIMGEIIWEASDEEIRQMWNKTPKEDRHRFWTHDEVTAHLLDTPQEIQECIEAKRAKPGRL